MATLPAGTVSFFFSDIEGSTRLFEALGDRYPDVLNRHNEIIREAIRSHSGVEVSTEGDSFFAAFDRAAHGVAAAVDVQRVLAQEEWPAGFQVRVRIGVHTGEARVAGATYVGLDVHRAARVMSAAHGGQVLVSGATAALVARELGDGVALRDLGEHGLRDLSGRERLFQVVVDGLPDDFPSPRTLDATPNNLPVQPGGLVGRDGELLAVCDYLQSPQVRLLTLTGPGGIGKTRLALQAGARLLENFRDGVYFVDLAAARDAEGALQAIVQAVGLTVAANQQLRPALEAQLRTRRLLLILDNFEQVMDAADDVAELLRRCADLKVLVTSREALRVRGEYLHAVTPLSADESLRLLVTRAREASGSFGPTDENTAALEEISIRLDGLPLAIELAAARLRLFSPRELSDRLTRRLDLLRGGARDLPARQRTLRSTIEWSYDLLDNEERTIFQLLALFPSARLDAVEAVAGNVTVAATIDVVDRITSLLDKSLVRSVVNGDEQRLSMLETIREYAAEQLASQPTTEHDARRAHAEYFANFARAQRADLDRGMREGALLRLEAELPNLRLAWRHLVTAADLVQVQELLDGLWVLYEARGWYAGAVALTNDVLDVLAKVPTAAERAEDEITLRMSIARGVLAIRGYTDAVEQLYREVLALSETTGLLPRRLPVLRGLASFYLARGDIEKTIEVGRELLELGRRENDATLQVEGHMVLGPVLAVSGHGGAGLDHLEQVIALFDPERDGDVRFRLGPSAGVAARAVSALLYWLFGRPDTSAERARSALTLAAQLNHPYSSAYATFHVALLDIWGRRFELADRHARDVCHIADEHGYQVWRALGLVAQGVTTSALGDPEVGLARAEEGIGLYEHLTIPPIFLPHLLGLRAEALQLAGRGVDAISVLDRAIALGTEDVTVASRLSMQKADVLLSLGDVEAADRVLTTALDEARSAGVRGVELPVATRLARLRNRPRETAVLREVYASFAEGLDTPDLLDARATLAALEASAGDLRSS